MSERMDYTTNPPTPITADNAKAYISELSKLAQEAENRGDNLMADCHHQAINNEIDALRELNS